MHAGDIPRRILLGQINFNPSPVLLLEKPATAACPNRVIGGALRKVANASKVGRSIRWINRESSVGKGGNRLVRPDPNAPTGILEQGGNFIAAALLDRNTAQRLPGENIQATTKSSDPGIALIIEEQ